ncbi:hypothetical protein LDENG_00212350 [Lucifuga dentata]|nr:hypothetical protein LDENG_00212350 [Lucifuga dentata]
MIDSYGEDLAVDFTVEILKMIHHNKAAQKLKETYKGGTAAEQNQASAPSTTSSVAGPPAGAAVCAQGRSVIVAPNISGDPSGVTINMKINN